ncbi:hypothetical protein HS125_06595 [bacterium]|nr:hypothetical protein [bacterium]
MVAFVKDKIMTVVMPATAEETRKMNEMLDGMMKHLSGDMMVAYQVQPDKPGGFMGMAGARGDRAGRSRPRVSSSSSNTWRPWGR